LFKFSKPNEEQAKLTELLTIFQEADTVKI